MTEFPVTYLHAACRICGCTETQACVDADGNGCRWVRDLAGPGPLCSSCEWIPAAISAAHELVEYANTQVRNGDTASAQALAAVASAYAAVAAAAQTRPGQPPP